MFPKIRHEQTIVELQRSVQNARDARSTPISETAMCADLISQMRRSQGARERTYLVFGDYSEASGYDEHIAEPTRTPFGREIFEFAAAHLKPHSLLDAQPGTPSRIECVLTLGNAPEQVKPANLRDSSASHSVILTVADSIFDVSDAPITRAQSFAIPRRPPGEGTVDMSAEALLAALHAPHGLGPCLQIELGAAAPAAFAHEIADEVLACGKHTHPDKFVATTSGSYRFFERYLPDLAENIPVDKRYGIHQTIEGTCDARPYREIRSVAYTRAQGEHEFRGDEDRIVVTAANNDARVARQQYIEQ